ncbi:MAG: hypothetical protein ACLTTO_07535 [Lachnospiraceae bacterium]
MKVWQKFWYHIFLKQTKGKEKLAAEEIKALLYRSSCYRNLPGDYKKEAMWDAFAALKRQKQVKNQDAYLRSLGYKILASCYRENTVCWMKGQKNCRRNAIIFWWQKRMSKVRKQKNS